MMSIEIFRLYVCVYYNYMYISAVRHSVYTRLYFFRYAHAHTTSQAREWSKHFNVELEKEGKLCDIERLKRKKTEKMQKQISSLNYE